MKPGGLLVTLAILAISQGGCGGSEFIGSTERSGNVAGAANRSGSGGSEWEGDAGNHCRLSDARSGESGSSHRTATAGTTSVNQHDRMSSECDLDGGPVATESGSAAGAGNSGGSSGASGTGSLDSDAQGEVDAGTDS